MLLTLAQLHELTTVSLYSHASLYAKCILCSNQHNQHFVYAHCFFNMSVPYLYHSSVLLSLLLGMLPLLVVLLRVTLYIVSHSLVSILQGFYVHVYQYTNQRKDVELNRTQKYFHAGIGGLLACIFWLCTSTIFYICSEYSCMNSFTECSVPLSNTVYCRHIPRLPYSFNVKDLFRGQGAQ